MALPRKSVIQASLRHQFMLMATFLEQIRTLEFKLKKNPSCEEKLENVTQI